VFAVLVALTGIPLLRWGMNWGSTAAEQARTMPGDEWLSHAVVARVTMTRAITIDASPGDVWPWIAQAGRGAGWYSYDWIDNGRRVSAWEIVSWIPEPQRGDATAIGYLRELEPGRSVTWWVPGLRFAGAWARLVVSYHIESEDTGTRVVARMSADATGWTGRAALLLFRIMDSVMARRQLLGLRERIETKHGGGSHIWEVENGRRDQFQLYGVIYASGERAGAEGFEQAALWRQAAIDDGVIDTSDGIR